MLEEEDVISRVLGYLIILLFYDYQLDIPSCLVVSVSKFSQDT